MNIYYSDEDGRLSDEIRGLMERAAHIALKLEYGDSVQPEDTDAEIGVTVVSADEIRELNREYRNNDSVTDVLSFPQFPDPASFAEETAMSRMTVLLGDVVICYDRAVSQSEEYGTGLTRELVYLFVHSVLHLLGYDHMEDDERAEMRTREEEIMNAIGVGR